MSRHKRHTKSYTKQFWHPEWGQRGLTGYDLVLDRGLFSLRGYHLTKLTKSAVTGSDLVPGFSFQPSRQPKKRPVKSKKKHNSSPQRTQRTQRTQRKKILTNLCYLRDLCGEIFLENGIGYWYFFRFWYLVLGIYMILMNKIILLNPIGYLCRQRAQ